MTNKKIIMGSLVFLMALSIGLTNVSEASAMRSYSLYSPSSQGCLGSSSQGCHSSSSQLQGSYSRGYISSNRGFNSGYISSSVNGSANSSSIVGNNNSSSIVTGSYNTTTTNNINNNNTNPANNFKNPQIGSGFLGGNYLSNPSCSSVFNPPSWVWGTFEIEKFVPASQMGNVRVLTPSTPWEAAALESTVWNTPEWEVIILASDFYRLRIIPVPGC